MQKLAEICVQRPVFATVLMLILVVIGGAGFAQLGVDRYPKVEIPTVLVTTDAPGTSPEAVESDITKRIENAVNTISGVDEVRSTSSEGTSSVTVSFLLEKDINVAAQEVRDSITQVIPDLPEGTRQPTVDTFNPDASPVLTLALSGAVPLREVTEYADKTIRKQLEGAGGVGAVDLIGGQHRQVEVELNPYRMRSYGVTATDVIDALRAQNVEMPGGQVEGATRNLTLRTLGRLNSVAEFNRIVLKTTAGGGTVRLANVATIADGASRQTSAAALNDKQTVQLSIRKQSGTNALAVIAGVKARLENIEQTLPAGYKLTVTDDASTYIEASVRAVEEHLIVGAILATLVVLLFLLSWRSTLIAAVSIPTSILATFGVMWVLGLSLNLITLLALTLAVGIVIDDAIVVLENIYRLMEEEGKAPFEAAIEGTREIGLAVLATTLSLVAVFLPVAFMSGIVGRFMNSFGITMSAAILVSLLVSFTLTPMMCARMLQRPKFAKSEDSDQPANSSHVHAEPNGTSGFYRHIDRAYTAMLKWSLGHRWVIVVACVAAIAAIVPLGNAVPFNFLPDEDESKATISFAAPEGTSLEATMQIARSIEAQARQLPGIKYIETSAGGDEIGSTDSTNAGTVSIEMTPLDQRAISQDDLVRRIRTEVMPQFASQDLRSIVSGKSGLEGGGRAGATIQYVISGPDLDVLSRASQAALEKFKNVPGVVDADTSLKTGNPELQVQINRDLAAQLGVAPADIATALRYFVGGDNVTTYNEKGEQYNVYLRATRQFRENSKNIGVLTVASTKLGAVPLGQVVTFINDTGPASIEHFNRLPQVTLSSNIKPGASESDVSDALENIIKNLNLGPDYSASPSGTSKELAKTASSFLIAVVLSLIFMYLILAAQFESWVHPITIMMSLPLTIPFALFSLLLFGQSINIFSMLGILVLFGIVKKNSILQIDRTNALRERGLSRYDAIIRANRDRLRPILMTTLAFVAGMIPLLISSGVGSGTNRAIGSVIFGGQSFSLLLTLLATPVIYSLFDDFIEWSSRVKARAFNRKKAGKRTNKQGETVVVMGENK